MCMESVGIRIRGGVVRVDAPDEAAVRARRWRVQRNPSGVAYPTTTLSGRGVSLGRWLMAPPPGKCVSHRNGDPLDCRRSNLSVGTRADAVRGRTRAWGSSRFKGVSRQGKGWVSGLKFKGKKRHLGFYSSQGEAALAYDKEARRIHGADAVVNFPAPGELGVRLR